MSAGLIKQQIVKCQRKLVALNAVVQVNIFQNHCPNQTRRERNLSAILALSLKKMSY